MTFSLRQLLLSIGLLSSVLGLGTKAYLEDWGVRIISSHILSTSQGSSYYWHAASFGATLRHGVIRPLGLGTEWGFGRGKTSHLEVYLKPDGIYLHGQPIPMTARIYIYTAAGTMEPIELSKDELDEIGIKPDTESKAWQEKVAPLIDIEYQLGRERMKAGR